MTLLNPCLDAPVSTPGFTSHGTRNSSLSVHDIYTVTLKPLVAKHYQENHYPDAVQLETMDRIKTVRLILLLASKCIDRKTFRRQVFRVLAHVYNKQPLDFKEAVKVLLLKVSYSSYCLLNVKFFLLRSFIHVSRSLVTRSKLLRVPIFDLVDTEFKAHTPWVDAIYERLQQEAASFLISREDTLSVLGLVAADIRKAVGNKKNTDSRIYSRLKELHLRLNTTTMAQLLGKLSMKAINEAHSEFDVIYKSLHLIIKRFVFKKLKFLSMYSQQNTSLKDLESEITARVLSVYYGLHPHTMNRQHLMAYMNTLTKSRGLNLLDEHLSEKRSVFFPAQAVTQNSAASRPTSTGVVRIASPITNHHRHKMSFDQLDDPLNRADLSEAQNLDYSRWSDFNDPAYARIELGSILSRYRRNALKAREAFYETAHQGRYPAYVSLLHHKAKIAYNKYRLVGLVIHPNRAYSQHLISTGVLCENETNIDLALRYDFKALFKRACVYLGLSHEFGHQMCLEVTTLFKP